MCSSIDASVSNIVYMRYTGMPACRSRLGMSARMASPVKTRSRIRDQDALGVVRDQGAVARRQIVDVAEAAVVGRFADPDDSFGWHDRNK